MPKIWTSLKINGQDHQYVQNVENQITQNWNVKIPLTVSTAQENTLRTHRNMKRGKKNNRNKIHKKHLLSRGQKNNRKNPKDNPVMHTYKNGNKENKNRKN